MSLTIIFKENTVSKDDTSYIRIVLVCVIS